ncbi:MAG: hypothetical protein J0H74_03235 [Chitinophagaceae bacterium]|nr:hypothetical protein [Chitinophagaceae bacterium]
MKKLYVYIAFIIGLAACNKVDNNHHYIDGLPHLNLSTVHIQGVGDYSYPTNVTIGDTMIMVGVLFIHEPGTTIHIGNADAKVVATSVLPGNAAIADEDIVRVLITSDMGVGANRPVTITANGHSINAPSITISQFVQLQSKTDTTLWVDSIGSWTPPPGAFVSLLDINSTDDGTLYFDNSTGVYRLNNGVVEKLLDTTQTVTENGNTYKAVTVLGCTTDHAGGQLYISMSVKENGVLPADRMVYRLCKMDMQSRTLTTINRTEVLKAGTAVTTPFEGDVASVPIVATQLKTDVNGNLYYHNRMRSTGLGIFTKYLDNFCRLDISGKISSLMVLLKSISVPGIALHMTTLMYAIDPQGKTIYVMDNKTGSSLPIDMNILAYDIELSDVAYSSGSTVQILYNFSSFDTSSLTGQPSGKNNLRPFTSWLALPNGDLITANDFSSYPSPSLQAVNIPSRTFYVYAGTERGLFTSFINVNNCEYSGPGQVNTTGLAKYVRFSLSPCRPGYPGFTTALAGIDPHGTVYYCTYGNTSISFFKMYSRK